MFFSFLLRMQLIQVLPQWGVFKLILSGNKCKKRRKEKKISLTVDVRLGVQQIQQTRQIFTLKCKQILLISLDLFRPRVITVYDFVKVDIQISWLRNSKVKRQSEENIQQTVNVKRETFVFFKIHNTFSSKDFFSADLC